MEYSTFLHDIFIGKPENLHLLIWTLPDKVSRWFTDLNAAVECVGTELPGYDVYFGLGLAPQGYGSGRRCKANDVAAIGGVWADIDVAGPNHKKQNLPTCREDVDVLLGSMPSLPTYIIDTGGGYHCYWLFDQLWVFEDAADRKRAAALTKGWNDLLRAKGREHGWDVDGVGDLSRLLRVPGTQNRKDKIHPRPVTVDGDLPAYRFPAHQFETWLREGLPQETEGAPAATLDPVQVVCEGNLVIDPNANPPFDKWELLREMEPKAVESWNRKRKDLQDQSASGYDLSLATYAAIGQWTDQEIVDLLIAANRKFGALPKRAHYYKLTIEKARITAKKLVAADFIDNLEVLKSEGEAVSPGEDEREFTHKILQSLSDSFGVTITRILRYTSDPPQYRIETTTGAISLGGVANLITEGNLRNAIAAATGRYIPSFKKRWEAIAQALLDACEDDDIGVEATDRGLVHSWLLDYLDQRRPLEVQTESLATRYPLRRDGRVYLFGDNLRTWLKVERMENVTSKEIGQKLRIYGAESCVVAFTQEDGTQTTRYLWRLPRGM